MPVSDITHETNLVLIAALYTKATRIDPANPPEPCSTSGATGTGCKPQASIEMQAAPIAAIDIDAAPITDLTQDEIPVAVLTCKILS